MFPVAPERKPGIGTNSRVFLVDTQGDVACGFYRVTLQLGHREILIPCGRGRHVLNARGVTRALPRSAAPEPLHCPEINCGAHHPGRDALEAAVRASPGFRRPRGSKGNRRRRRPTQLGAPARMGPDHRGYKTVP